REIPKAPMGRRGSEARAVNADKIRQLMHAQNISKSELSRRTGITVKQIRNILDKRSHPREDTIARIASVLGVQWHVFPDDYAGELQSADEQGGVAVKTTVDMLITTSEDITAEELRDRIVKALLKAGDNRLEAADVIRIIKMRSDDAV